MIVRRPAQSHWGINSVSSRSPHLSLNLSPCLSLFLSLHSFLIFLLCHFHLPFLLFFHFSPLRCRGRLIMARGLDKLSPQPSGDWATCVPLCEPTNMKTHKHTHAYTKVSQNCLTCKLCNYWFESFSRWIVVTFEFSGFWQVFGNTLQKGLVL